MNSSRRPAVRRCQRRAVDIEGLPAGSDPPFEFRPSIAPVAEVTGLQRFAQGVERCLGIAGQAEGLVVATDLLRIDVDVNELRGRWDQTPAISPVLICARTNKEDDVSLVQNRAHAPA